MLFIKCLILLFICILGGVLENVKKIELKKKVDFFLFGASATIFSSFHILGGVKYDPDMLTG